MTETQDVDSSPDAITPVEGFRLWWVDWRSCLISQFTEVAWNTHGVTQAFCWTSPRQWTKPSHSAPQEGCSCGLYAVKEFQDIVPNLVPQPPTPGLPLEMAGKVQLWGKVVEHDRGYRGQFGRIVELIPPTEEAEQLARGIVPGIPIRIDPFLRQWVRLLQDEWAANPDPPIPFDTVRRMLQRILPQPGP